MKNIFYITLAVFTLISCRKDDMVEKPIDLVEDPFHCLNGIYDPDEGEESVDCGGPCQACEFVEAPCSTQMDTIEVNNGFAGNETYIITDVTKTIDEDDGAIHINVQTSGAENFDIYFDEFYFEPNAVYQVVNETPGSFDFTQGHAIIESEMVGYSMFGSGLYDFKAVEGEVYLNLIGGSYQLEFCDVIFTRYNGNYDYTDCAAKFTYND